MSRADAGKAQHLAVAWRLLISGNGLDNPIALHAWTWVVNRGVMDGLGITVLSACSKLSDLLDIYCSRSSFKQMDINEAVSERKSLQVALRTGPSTLVLMTLVLQTTVFCTLLAGAIDVQGNRPWCSALKSSCCTLCRPSVWPRPSLVHLPAL